MIEHSRPWLLPEDKKAVDSALAEGAICHWRHAASFADRLAEYAGVAKCRLFNTGTLALRAALCALELPAGSGVAIPAFTCSDVWHGVTSAGLCPVVFDCDDNGLLDASLVKAGIQVGRVYAVVAVHQFGLINRAVETMVGRIPVVEDCSHVPPRAHLAGSSYVFGSLEGTKLLGAGEGGYLFAPRGPQQKAGEIGERLSDLISVLGMQQLNRLAENLSRRKTIAEHFESAGVSGVVDCERAAWFRFLLRMKNRTEADKFLRVAEEAGIRAKRPIMPQPIHRLPGIVADPCPVADRLWETIISIPLYPALDEAEVSTISRFLEAQNAG